MKVIVKKPFKWEGKLLIKGSKIDLHAALVKNYTELGLIEPQYSINVQNIVQK